MFINTLQPPVGSADMAELTRLREENAALRSEADALRSRLAAYECAEPPLPAAVAAALEEMHRQCPMQTASDWAALWWVLTTLAKAPQPYSEYAAWVEARRPAGLPPCKVSLLYKADAVYRRAPHRWEECTTQQRSTLQRRLLMARCLKRLLS